MNQFLEDVVRGLSASPKYLESKYFYNEAGDQLFENLMESPEYYLTACESEIFRQQGAELASLITARFPAFNLVELGAGDASKSVHLFSRLMELQAGFTYYPIDISSNVISQLQQKLPVQLPGMQVHGLSGEYFQMLSQAALANGLPKFVLFLGSNIGNFLPEQTDDFCRELRAHLNTGDLLLSGFDLKKDPATILAAYNDKAGITRQFNINLLRRINQELEADFMVDDFLHYPVYDPQTGSCKSFLVSTKAQKVSVGKGYSFEFDKYEAIFMEISQKYTLRQIEDFANRNGFRPVRHFFDSKGWFVDSLWECI
jgi:L-histidine N-alpha-methyltransferase